MIPRQNTKIVHLAVYKGRSEFYSGVRHGALVWLTEDIVTYDYEDRNQWGHVLNRRRAAVSLSVQGFWQDTGHLAVDERPHEVEVIA